jgi:hypothetical protein
MVKWQTYEILIEDHFNGIFIFQNDLDFLGEKTNCQFFCDVFNDMVSKRTILSKKQNNEAGTK